MLIPDKTAANAAANWSTIENHFEKKSNELNIAIDNLDDSSAFDARIDSATAKYEAFRNLILHQKIELEAGNFPTQ